MKNEKKKGTFMSLQALVDNVDSLLSQRVMNWSLKSPVARPPCVKVTEQRRSAEIIFDESEDKR